MTDDGLIGKPAETVLGPCPGCQTWTARVPYPSHPEVADAAIRAHMERCPPLAKIAAERGITLDGRPIAAQGQATP